MKKPVLYFLPFVILTASSCKKNPLPPNEASAVPVFYVKAELNAVPLNIEAGINDYYMSSSHYMDSNNVYVYKGELKQKSCSYCQYSVAFLINDHKVSQQHAVMNPDSGLVLKKYEFNDGALSPLGYQGTFSCKPSGPLSYTFNFGSESSVGQPASRLFEAGSTASVTLNVEDVAGGSCTASHMNVFEIGNPLQVNINAIKQEPLTFSFTPASTKTNYKTIEWDFGDQSPHSTDLSPIHNFTEPGYYRVKLSVVTTDNFTCVSYYQAAAFPSEVCQANYTSTFVPVANTWALGAITILVTDPANGKVYSSANFDQPSSSNFEIVSVEDYQNNEVGESTKKLKIRFNCVVKNGSESLNITNGEAVLAVSYK